MTSEDGRTEDPDLSILVAEDQPAEPLTWLLGAALPVKNRHMLAPADDAKHVDFFGQIPRQLAVRELVAGDHLIHGERHGAGEVAREFPVLAFVGRFDEVAPQRLGHGQDLVVGFLSDVHRREQFYLGYATPRPGPGDSRAPSPWCIRRSSDRGAKPSARASSRRPPSWRHPGSSNPASGSPCGTACAA